MRTAEKVSASEWAVKNVQVTDGAHPGPFRLEYAPHTDFVMKAFSQPWTREVWFCGVEQSGKTRTMLNCLAWTIDVSPGNIFYLMPTEDTATKITAGKIRPMLAKTVQLRKYLSSRQDDTGLSRIHLTHGVTIFPAHANSAASMATWPAKYCFGDEVDKYPLVTGKETDPITLIKKRNRTYKGRYKRFFASTPAGRFIHRGMKACRQVWEWRNRCPHCQELIRMDPEHLVFPDLANTDARYACNTCGGIWTEAEREKAIHAGRWFCLQGAEISRPSTIGFHHRAWDCLDITLAEIAQARKAALTGGPAEKIAWANGYEAIDYVPERQDRKENLIYALADDRPSRLIPGGGIVAALTASADTQDNGLWYEIRAWGWGLTTESWQIRFGFVSSFAELEEVIFTTTYQDAEGLFYPVHLLVIDAMGHRTGEVYDFVRKHPGRCQAYRGGAGRKANPQTWTNIDRYPGTTIQIPGGIRLVTIDTHHYKDLLSGKLQIKGDDPGAWHLLASVEENDPHGIEYARQMCAEYVNERNLWQCPAGKANHFWDCGVMNLVAADLLQIKYWQKGK
jgi:phage terminase large subunit GpA-like protein